MDLFNWLDHKWQAWCCSRRKKIELFVYALIIGGLMLCVCGKCLSVAPAERHVFMQLINEVLHDYLHVLLYLDDMIIYTETMEEHVKLVQVS